MLFFEDMIEMEGTLGHWFFLNPFNYLGCEFVQLVSSYVFERIGSLIANEFRSAYISHAELDRE